MKITQDEGLEGPGSGFEGPKRDPNEQDTVEPSIDVTAGAAVVFVRRNAAEKHHAEQTAAAVLEQAAAEQWEANHQTEALKQASRRRGEQVR